MPDWLNTRRLSQNQMESSFVDNRVAIKNAFETLINVNLKTFNKHDIFEESDIKESVTNRVANLLNGKKLPYMKRFMYQLEMPRLVSLMFETLLQ
jgi:hypothetical protein